MLNLLVVGVTVAFETTQHDFTKQEEVEDERGGACTKP